MATFAIADTIAAYVRTIDGNNDVPADLLGWKIAERLTGLGRPVNPTACAAFVRDINADKQMSAGLLAEKILDRFAITY